MLQIKPKHRNKQVGTWCSWESQGLKFYHHDIHYKKSRYFIYTDVYKNIFIFLLCEAENTAKHQRSDWLSTKFWAQSRLKGKILLISLQVTHPNSYLLTWLCHFQINYINLKLLTKLQNPFLMLCIIAKIFFISSQNHTHILFMRRVLTHASVRHSTEMKTNSYIPTVMSVLESLVRYSSTGPET